MKLPILTATVLLLLGTTASIYARQEKGQDDHSQEAKPAKQEAKPAQQPQAKPAERQQTEKAAPAPQAKPAEQAKTTPQQQPKAKPAERQQTQSVKPAQQQHTQQAASSKQPVHGTSGVSAHGRISNAHYTASFGSGHSFHVNQGAYTNRRFQYGGYSFGFIDAWPVAWGYSDNVYVVYVDGGYYMYDAFHPGLRISLNIL